MSKADGTAFGRPFAPFIAVANSGNKPSYSSLDSVWNSYMEPYYQNWAHPDDGVEFIIYLHVLYWSGFYVNQNNKPSNPTNQNDSAYDWSYLDGIFNGVNALRTGKARLHFRWDTESSGIPNFLENQGDTFLGTGDRPVAAWHRTNVQNDAMDFFTAFSARYNGANWLAHISHEEDNPGPNPPSDWSGAAWTSGRARVVRHSYNLLTQHTVFLGQSSGVHEHLDDIPVGRMMDDPKPGAFGCGSDNEPYPVFDCTDGVIAGIQDFNGTIANPPGGIPKPVFLSSMPNGWGSRNDGNYGSSNPWGVPYPIPGETSNPSTPLGDPDWNATQHLSYTAGEPRAPSPDDNSNLGNPGRDNAGIVPSMGVMVHPGNDTAQAWNRAFQLFGGPGTRAAPAVPHDWFSGGGGGGGTTNKPTNLPSVTGPQPTFVEGNITFNPSGVPSRQARIWIDTAEAATKDGPLVFYFHGTDMSHNDATWSIGLNNIADIKSQGGIVVALHQDPSEPYAWAIANGDLNQNDNRLVDEIVACAIAGPGIDTTRIHATGLSAGGMISCDLAIRRANYIASTAPMSGGFETAWTPIPPNAEPGNKSAHMVFHGGVTDVWPEGSQDPDTRYEINSERFSDKIVDNGGFILMCDHGLGHTIPDDSPDPVWQFFQDHPWNSLPSPYTTSGVPPSFPSYCNDLRYGGGLGWWVPPLGTTWTYQITGTVDQSVNANNYIIDLFDSATSLVSSLHNAGRKVYAYFSAGSWEDWRPDADDYPSGVKGNALEGFPNENWLDIREIETLRPLIVARLQLAVDGGYDGVDPDNMDGYQNNSGFPLTATHQLAFNRMVAEEAHDLGLSCGLKNTVDLIPQLVGDFDFCVNEEAFRYDEENTLIPFITASKSVFNVEYRSQDLDCATANSLGIYQVLKTLDLNATRTPCEGFGPPGGGGGSGNEITVIVGYSVTQQWTQALMAAHTNTNIIAVIVGGGDIDYWNTGTNMADGNEESWSTNSGDKETGDVIVYQVAGPVRSVSQWETDIEEALVNIRTVFTNLSRITLIPVTGGPNNGLCPSSGANNIDGNVRDSVTHPDIEQAVSNVASQYGDVDWVDQNVDQCSWYQDGIGHVTDTGADGLGEQMWNALFATLPPPSGVIANPDTLAHVDKNSGQFIVTLASLMSNDSGTGLSITAVSNAVGCVATLDTPNGRVEITPNTDFSGNATFRYTLTGSGGTSSTQVTFSVGNQAPAMNISYPIGYDGVPVNAGVPYGLGVQGVDPDGDNLTYAVEAQPVEGSVSFSGVVDPISQLTILTFSSLSTSAGIVTGTRVSCTDDDLSNPLKSNILDIDWDVIPSEEGVFSVTIDENEATVTETANEHIYGVTIDDISSLSDITDAIDSLGVYATTRIVFDEGQSASSYRTAFNAIKGVSDVMGEIMDSSAMSGITVANFKTRVDDYLGEFGTEVDIWEIGNEVNGDWLGSTASVVEKIEYAYDEVVAIGGTTALTLYYNDNCNSGSDEMFTWAEANVATRLKAGLDLVIVSYWEEDCGDDRPDWGPVFTQLGEMFPNSNIGFSEVGSEGSAATREAFMEYYYGLTINHPRYIGGHFWWYFKTDAVPKTKDLWAVLNTAITNTPVVPGWISPPTSTPDFTNSEGSEWVVSTLEIQADNIQVAKPTNLTAGDTLVIIVACDGNDNIDMTIDPTGGWINRHNTHVSGTSLAVFDKVVTDSEPGTYKVTKGGVNEEWIALAIRTPAGTTYDSKASTSGIGTTGTAPSLTPNEATTLRFAVVASDDPDLSEDANVFTNATMICNRWSSNTSGMAMLAVGYDTQDVAQATGDHDIAMDIENRWEGLTLAYTQPQSGYTEAFGGDTLLSENGTGLNTVCYTTTPSGVEKNWVRIYAQWPNNDITSNSARYTINIGGVDYPDVFVAQFENGGQMNLISSIPGPISAGDITVCIYDSASTPVFADAVRIDYSVGEEGFITYTATSAANGTLKATRLLTSLANGYVLEAGGSLFTFTKTAQADAYIKRPTESWDTVYRSEKVWVLENSKQ